MDSTGRHEEKTAGKKPRHLEDETLQGRSRGDKLTMKVSGIIPVTSNTRMEACSSAVGASDPSR
jgi:hypothetical protein